MKIVIRIIAVLVILVAAMMAYFILTEPDIPTPPPVPTSTGSLEMPTGTYNIFG